MNSQTICSPAGATGRERTRFFPRQLITPDDLTQDQIYFREKMRRHNRLLHGWGVVCGAKVAIEESDADDYQVTVEPGYILGPYGDEIVIDREVTFKLEQQGPEGDSFALCADVSDPWCQDIEVDRGSGPLYVAVRYDECRARPVRVKAGDCGCSESGCEYSRIRDSFIIRILDALPDSHGQLQQERYQFLSFVPGAGRGRPGLSYDSNNQPQVEDCPPCPTSPWVVLATLTRENGSWQADNFRHRRFAYSQAKQYYRGMAPAEEEGGGFIGKIPALEDVTAGTEAVADYLVRMNRPERGAVYLPVHYSVEDEQTLQELLREHGGREYRDPQTGQTYQLRDLYAMTDVDLNQTVSSVAEALRPLERVTLRPGALRETRNQLEGLLNDSGRRRLMETFAGQPGAATNLTASDLIDVDPETALGERSVAEITTRERDAFVSEVLEGVPEGEEDEVRAQAEALWDKANNISSLIGNWRDV